MSKVIVRVNPVVPKYVPIVVLELRVSLIIESSDSIVAVAIGTVTLGVVMAESVAVSVVEWLSEDSGIDLDDLSLFVVIIAEITLIDTVSTSSSLSGTAVSQVLQNNLVVGIWVAVVSVRGLI